MRISVTLEKQDEQGAQVLAVPIGGAGRERGAPRRRRQAAPMRISIDVPTVGPARHRSRG